MKRPFTAVTGVRIPVGTPQKTVRRGLTSTVRFRSKVVVRKVESRRTHIAYVMLPSLGNILRRRAGLARGAVKSGFVCRYLLRIEFLPNLH